MLAPADGIITARTATVGAVVPAGQELFRMIKDGRLTDQTRLVLMCDVERPMHAFGRAFSRGYSQLARALAVPNTHEDPCGWLTAVFASVAPLRERAMTMKARHRGAYLPLKYLLNATLLLLAFLPVYAVLRWVEHAGIAVLY